MVHRAMRGVSGVEARWINLAARTRARHARAVSLDKRGY
jgi:hypothetical protein